MTKNMYLPRLRIAIKRVNGSNGNLQFHKHDAVELVIVLRGQGALHWVNGKAHQLHRGDILLLQPELTHAYENCGSMHIVNILYNPDQLPLPPLDGNELMQFRNFMSSKPSAEEPEKPVLCLDENDTRQVEQLADMLEKEINSDQPGKNLCAFGIFIALLTKIIQAGGKAEQDEKLSSAARALNFINLHYMEDISIDKLSRLCNLSRAGLFRHFRKLTGCTPKEYQRRKRLETAEAMLLTTNKSFSEIADECGFYDSNHLAKIFRQLENTTPKKLRQKGKKLLES